MTGHERQFAISGAIGREPEKVRGLRWLAVFVDSQQRHVQVVPWEREVVRVPTKERGAELGSEHQPDILVALVSVKMVGAAMVERDDVAAPLAALGAGLFDARHLGLLRLAEVWTGFTLCRLVDAVGDVRDLDELIDLDLGTFHLGSTGLGKETVFHQVVLGRRELLDASAGAMVIGQDQPVLRDE